jgi:hypothetical protein
MSTVISARHAFAKATLAGGLAAALLDAADAIVAFKAVLGLGPVAVYQSVASGILGPRAFDGGLATGLFGFALHFIIAFSAAAVFTCAATLFRPLRDEWIVSGAVFGVAVYCFMNYVVIPLSALSPAPFSLPLFVNGILGHAMFVGLPIAYFARHYLVRAAAA